MKLTDKLLLGSALVGGFLLQLGTLAFFPIPEGNRELFAQGIGTLNTAVGAIVLSLWKSDTPKASRPVDPPPLGDGRDEPR